MRLPGDTGAPDVSTDPRPHSDLGSLQRRALALLAVVTAIGSTGLAAGGTAGALLGAQMTGTEAMAGLPLGLLVVGSAAAAIVVSRLTSFMGWGRSLALGYVLGLLGATLVVAATAVGNFVALLLGSTILGAGNVAVFLARYAAAEVGGEATRGRALGTVFFAAAVGSILGPNLLGSSGEVAAVIGLPRLAGLYLVAILCFATAALLLAAASYPGVPYLGKSAALRTVGKRSRMTKGPIASDLKLPAARTGLLILAATNMVMVAVMAIAPVHLAIHEYNLGLVGTVVGIHVGCMFVPSPISGWIADSLGPTPVAEAGFFFLATAGVAGAFLDTGSAVWMAVMLMLLGVGWNFGVVGGSTMLAGSIPAPLRPHAEGLGEVAMGLAAGAGAPIAGIVVALGGFTALSLVGVAVAAAAAILTLAFIRWAA